MPSDDAQPQRPAPSIGKAEVTMLASGGCRRLARLNMENFSHEGANLAFGSTPALRAQGADGQRSERLRAQQLRSLLNRDSTRHHAAQNDAGKRSVMKLRDVITQARTSGNAVNFFSEVSFTPHGALRLPGVAVTVRAHEPDLVVTYQNEGRYQTMRQKTGQPPETSFEVCPDGQLRPIAATDQRLQLRVIDLKASAQTSRKQLLEAAWYALAMSTWLSEETSAGQPLSSEALVRADFGIWNGHAQTDPVPADDLNIMDALEWIHARFTTGDSEQLIGQLLSTVAQLPEVAAQPYTAQPWSLKPECEGCGFLTLSPPVDGQPPQPGGCAREASGTTRTLPAYDALLDQPAAQPLLNAPLTRANLSSGALRQAIGPEHMRALGTQQLAQTSGRTQVMSGMSPALNFPGGQDVSLSVWLERDSATGLIGGAGLQITHFVRAPGTSPETVRWAQAAQNRSAGSEAQLLRELLEQMHTQISAVEARRSQWPAPTDTQENRSPRVNKSDEGSFQLYLWDASQREAWQAGMGRLLQALGEHRPEWARLIWLCPPTEAAPWAGWSEGGLSVVAPELDRVLALPGTSRTLAAYSDLTRSPEDRAASLQARAQRRAAGGLRGRHLQVDGTLPPLSEERGFHLLMRHWQQTEEGAQDERATYNLSIYLHTQARLLGRIITELQVRGRQFGLKLTLSGQRGHVRDLQAMADAGLGPTHSLWVNQSEVSDALQRHESRMRQLRGVTIMQESGHAMTLRDLSVAFNREDASLTVQGTTTDRGARVEPGGFGLLLNWPGPTPGDPAQSRRADFITQERLNQVDDRVTLRLRLNAEEAKAPQALKTRISAARQWWVAAGPRYGTSKLTGALQRLGPLGEDPHQVNWRLRDPVQVRPTGSHPGLKLLHPSADEAQTSPTHLQAAADIARLAPNLTPAQMQAAQTLLTRRCGLLWGPPGTGKSQVLAAMIVSALQAGLRVLVTATNYGACDTLLSRTLKEAARNNLTLPLHARLASPARAAPGDTSLAALTITRNDARYGELRTHLIGGAPALISAPHQEAYTFLTRGDDLPAFDLIVVDEGSQMPASGLALPLCGASPTCTLVVAGDPLQLPAIQTPAPAGLDTLCGSAYAHLKRTLSQQALDLNWRSAAQIVDASRPAGYDQNLRAAHPGQQLKLLTSPESTETDPALDWMLSPEHPCVLVSHSEGTHRTSAREAEIITALATRLHLRLGAPSPEQFWKHDLGVVTPHRVQAALITQALQTAFPTHPPELVTASVGTADAYQGQERTTIMVSPGVGTRAGVNSEEDFIYAPERWNVAFSRAQAKLIVFMTPAVLGGLPEAEAAQRGLRLLQRFASRATEQGPQWPQGSAGRGLKPSVQTRPPQLWRWPAPPTAPET